MAIPDFQSTMLPLLKLHSDGRDHSIEETVQQLVKEFGLSADEVAQLIPSGRARVFYNRVAWARTHVTRAGLLQKTGRSTYKITDRGKEVLSTKIKRIDMKFLRTFPEYKWPTRANDAHDDLDAKNGKPDENTPVESLESAHQKLRDELAEQVLRQVLECSETFFERLVVDLLVEMGYGGSRKDAGQAIGKPGDGGIDGIIKEDRLGLDAVYIQAKRWDKTPVGRPEIQKFVGALQGHRARKGVFITASAFTKDARDYTTRIESKIILIDGHELADLMIDFNVGVSRVATYEVKKVDLDYFSED